jgi:hypothetical protein
MEDSEIDENIDIIEMEKQEFDGIRFGVLFRDCVSYYHEITTATPTP